VKGPGVRGQGSGEVAPLSRRAFFGVRFWEGVGFAASSSFGRRMNPPPLWAQNV
jgi:hypothetical protein